MAASDLIGGRAPPQAFVQSIGGLGDEGCSSRGGRRRGGAEFTTHDVAPAGVSSGDTLQARFTLTGRHQGTADFAWTAVVTNYVCQGVIRLADGDLYADTGPVDETQPAAIVGGTRAFDGARGQFTQVEYPDDRGRWTITLRH